MDKVSCPVEEYFESNTERAHDSFASNYCSMILSQGKKLKIIHIMTFSITMYRYESWTMNKTDRKKMDSIEVWYWRRVWGIL